MYVEAEAAGKELGVRHRGGFFQDNRSVPRTVHMVRLLVTRHNE